MLSRLLLALVVGAALSLLGLPAIPFSRRRRRSAVPLGTRWALFGWAHPRAARALSWTTAGTVAALAVWIGWPWISRPEALREAWPETWSEACAGAWAAVTEGAARLIHRP